MLRQYFAQSLLNSGVLSAEQVRLLLETRTDHQARIEIRALCQGVMKAEQIEKIKKRQKPDEDFAALAIAAGCMTESQRCSLEAMVPSTNWNFAQGMLDEHFVAGYSALEALLTDYEAKETMAVGTAINQVAMKNVNFAELEEECDLYSEYTDVFLRTLSRFMNIEAVINLTADPFIGEQSAITISQHLTGDIMLTTGIMAEEDVVLELARRYSQENIEKADALAVDSVAEFLNVTNGLYIVNLSNRHLNVDLDPYRSAYNVLPAGNKQLILRIDTDCGSFDLILAADEIIF